MPVVVGLIKDKMFKVVDVTVNNDDQTLVSAPANTQEAFMRGLNIRTCAIHLDTDNLADTPLTIYIYTDAQGLYKLEYDKQSQTFISFKSV